MNDAEAFRKITWIASSAIWYYTFSFWQLIQEKNENVDIILFSHISTMSR